MRRGKCQIKRFQVGDNEGVTVTRSMLKISVEIE